MSDELEHAQTLLAEWEALVGMPLPQAIAIAVARVDANQPYALGEAYEALTGAFHKLAQDRNMWRARAKRTADVEGKRGEGLCDCCEREGAPSNYRTLQPIEHHCDCRAVEVAAVLLGARSRTKHYVECGER